MDFVDGTRSKIANMMFGIKKKPLRVMLPRTDLGLEGKKEAEVTPVPKISDKNLSEIEIQPIKPGMSYVRINYDNRANEYRYEVIEPELTPDERRVLMVLKDKIINTLRMMEDPNAEKREEYLRRATKFILKNMGLTLNPLSFDRVFYYVVRDFIGYAAIDVMMIDPQVEDLSCDGANVPFYIYHRKYGSIQSNVRYTNHHDLDSFVVWLAQRCGKHISVAEPVLDATIPDGSRLNATLGMHVTKKGSSFTIRRFKDNPFTPIDLLRFKLMSIEMMAYLWLAIESGQSTLVCGGTASGKTTTLNGVLLFIPPMMKIVSIEDTRELNLPHENWIPSLTRSGFGARNPVTGKAPGEIDMFDLLTASMRMRPQYLMVGEVRGKEAYVVFQAMATGKTAYTTFHAEDVAAMVHRMENDPINLPRALVSALDIVLMQAQVKVGTKMTRRVKSLTEIVGIDPETSELITNSAYTWNPADDTFNFSGHSYVYTKIQQAKNWSARRMDLEVRRRCDILRYMNKAGVEGHKQVAKIVSSYLRDPERVIEQVNAELTDEDRRKSIHKS
ncbi:MAG TPA: secretion system protein E [Euryarchaeota archaeon]|nr:secretion system protein E [Euryarchaeota archaeon]